MSEIQAVPLNGNPSAKLRKVKFLARYPALAVFLVAVALRLVWAMLAHNSVPIDDADLYLRLGKNLALTGTYSDLGRPTAYMPVGYPFFLSLFYRLMANPLPLILGTQIMISSLTCSLVQILARQLKATPTAAFLAGLALALLPSSISLANTFLVETIFAFLVLVAFFLAASSNRFLAIVGSGLILGLACYVRPVALILAPLLFFPDLFLGQWRRYIFNTLLAGTVLISVVLPWGLRNQALFGRVVLISTNGGVNLYVGHNPQATGEYMCNSEMDALDSVKNEALRSSIFTSKAWGYLLTHPKEEIILFSKKLALLLFRDRATIYESLVKSVEVRDFGWSTRILAAVNNLFHLLLLWLFILTPWWKAGKNQGTLITYALVYWFQILFYCCFFVADRYKFPSTPFLLLSVATMPPALLQNPPRRLLPSLFLFIVYPVLRIFVWSLNLISNNKKEKIQPGSLPNLAVYQSYQVGDAFMALPALLLLKPHFSVTVICRPDCKGIFKREGFQVLAHANPFFAHATPANLWRSLSGAWKLRELIPMQALDLDADPRTACLLKVAGVGTTYAYRRPFGWLFDKTLPVLSDAKHQSEKQMAVTAAFLAHHNLPIQKAPSAVHPVPDFSARPLKILLSCWTWKDEKNWPLEYWDKLLVYLLEIKCPIQIIVPPEADPEFQNFRSRWKDQVNFLEGDLDAIQHAVRSASGIICTDNFLGHMAAFAGMPVFWINGSSDSAQVAPRGPGTKIVQVDSMPCRPCGHRCHNPIFKKCLIELLPERVQKELAQWLNPGIEI